MLERKVLSARQARLELREIRELQAALGLKAAKGQPEMLALLEPLERQAQRVMQVLRDHKAPPARPAE